MGLAGEQLGEPDGAELAEPLRDLRPGEHRRPRAVDLPADAREPVAEDVAPLAVDLGDGVRRVGRVRQRGDRGDLDGLERAVVEPRLEPGQTGDDRGVADEEATRQPAIENDLLSV